MLGPTGGCARVTVGVRMSSKDLRQEGLAFNSGNCFHGRKKVAGENKKGTVKTLKKILKVQVYFC